MSDPLTSTLLSGAHIFLVSCAWVLAFMGLALAVLCCLRAALGQGEVNPLVWLLTGTVLTVAGIILWTQVHPDLSWGLLGLGSPVVGIVSAVLKPRARRSRSVL